MVTVPVSVSSPAYQITTTTTTAANTLTYNSATDTLRPFFGGNRLALLSDITTAITPTAFTIPLTTNTQFTTTASISASAVINTLINTVTMRFAATTQTYALAPNASIGSLSFATGVIPAAFRPTTNIAVPFLINASSLVFSATPSGGGGWNAAVITAVNSPGFIAIHSDGSGQITLGPGFAFENASDGSTPQQSITYALF